MAKLEPHPLTRTIVDHPDADLPRLVYADWLDEQGDPKLAMLAEYIRLSIDKVAHPEDSHVFQEIETRRVELLQSDRWAILPPLPVWARELVHLERGLPVDLACSPEQFVDGAEVLELAPITRLNLRLDEMSDDNAPFAAALARPELRRLHWLRVQHDLNLDGFAALATNPNVLNLRALILEFIDDELSLAAAELLAGGASRFVALTRLEVWAWRASLPARNALLAGFGEKVWFNGDPEWIRGM